MRSKLSTSASWFLITCRHPPEALFSRATRAAARSLVQTFFSSPPDASLWKFEIAWATSCCSPLNDDVDTVLPHALTLTTTSAGRALPRDA